MKFIIACLIASVAAQEGVATCTKDAECADTEDGTKQRCATMTMEGFSVDQCVASILCGETMEIDEVAMNYNCFDTGANGATTVSLAASAAALMAVAYSAI